MSPNPTAEPASPSIDSDTDTDRSQAATTTRVKTPTSGIIHGTRVEALRIIAGSTFPVDDDTFVRLSPGNEDDETQFNVAIDVDSIDTRPYDGTDCIIGGAYDELFTPDDDATETRTRVEFQFPYDARKPFQFVKEQHPGSKHAEYRNNCVPRWNVTNEWVDTITKAVLDDGFAIVTRLSTLRDLYTPHPEHTVSSSGKYIITDDALVDPDHYETETPRPEAGHGKGGNPHSIEYFLAHGECPVPDCNAEFDRFRGLRSHVGGKASPNDEPGENAHDQLNLRRHEITVADEQPATTAD